MVDSDLKIWALELAQLFDSKDLDQMRAECLGHLDLLLYLHEVLAEENVEVQEYETTSEQLVQKFYFHGLTFCKISEGLTLSSEYFSHPNISKTLCIDIPSLLTVERAQLESLLMYQHIYVNTKNVDEQKLRYYSWIYTALIQRRQFSAIDEASKTQRAKDENEIIRLKAEMEKLDSFKKLSPKQQHNVFHTGSAKLFKNWSAIFEESGFSSSQLFPKLYYILSAYAHSEGLSVVQMRSVNPIFSKKENQEMLYLMMHCSLLMTGVMIENIVNRYDSVANRFKNLDQKKQYKASFYAKLARTSTK
jgi:hypothetical protein